MSQLFTCLSLQARSAEVVYKTVGSLQMKLYIDYPDDLKASEKRPAFVFYFGLQLTDKSSIASLKPSIEAIAAAKCPPADPPEATILSLLTHRLSAFFLI